MILIIVSFLLSTATLALEVYICSGHDENYKCELIQDEEKEETPVIIESQDNDLFY